MYKHQFKKIIGVTPENHKNAKFFAGLHQRCLEFLKKHNTFTTSGFTNDDKKDDFYVWYLTSRAYKKYRMEKEHKATNKTGLKINLCRDGFDLHKIVRITNTTTPTIEELNYIKAYCNTHTHIKIRKHGMVEKVYDIRSAFTQQKPDPDKNWNWLLPKEREDRRKNDVIVLHGIGKCERTIEYVTFSGIITHQTATQCNVVLEGHPTSKKMLNKTTSYETFFNQHFTTVEP